MQRPVLQGNEKMRKKKHPRNRPEENKYPAVHSKDAVIINPLVRIYGPEIVSALIKRYMDREDDFARKCGHNIGTFKLQVPSLLEENEYKKFIPKAPDIQKMISDLSYNKDIARASDSK